MSAWLDLFLNQPSAAEPWSKTASSSLYCIIDSVRQPRAVEQLYQRVHRLTDQPALGILLPGIGKPKSRISLPGTAE